MSDAAPSGSETELSLMDCSVAEIYAICLSTGNLLVSLNWNIAKIHEMEDSQLLRLAVTSCWLHCPVLIPLWPQPLFGGSLTPHNLRFKVTSVDLPAAHVQLTQAWAKLENFSHVAIEAIVIHLLWFLDKNKSIQIRYSFYKSSENPLDSQNE